MCKMTNSEVIHKLQHQRLLYILYCHSKSRTFWQFLLFLCLISREVRPARPQHHEFGVNTVDLSPHFTAVDSACCWSCRSWRCDCTLTGSGSQHYRHLCLLGDIRQKAKWTDVTLEDSSEFDFTLARLKTIVLLRPNPRFDLSCSQQEGYS